MESDQQIGLLALEPEIEAEYRRICGIIGAATLDRESTGVTVHDVVKAHFLIANHFYFLGSGMGGIGPRDIGLLSSAVGRQNVMYGSQRKWTDKFDLCATLLYGLIKNHPFYDANKRTAFLAALYHLETNGYCPAVSQKEFEDFTVEIAENSLSKYSRYESLREKNDADPEVRYISWFLRRNTRKIDRRNYAITYRELQAILKRYGFALENPSGNYIDIVKIGRKRLVLGLFGRETEHHIRVGNVGFPRWTAEVRPQGLKHVREVTGLTVERGFDAATFFHGIDPIQSLITTYHEPLQRLAGR